MKIFCTYFYMELKKSFKVLQKTVIYSVIGILLLLIGIVVIENQLRDKQSLELVDVAMVIPEEESLLKLGAQYISSVDSIESICNFQYMDEKRALKELKNNNVQAVIVFPQNFYEDVYYGVNTPATIYFSDQSDLNVNLFGEVLSDGISMLQISEAGVYSVLKVTRNDVPNMKRSKIGDFVADKYIDAILHRSDIFDTYVSSPYGKVNVTQYYYAAFVLLALFIYSINMGFLYKKHEKAISDKMMIYGLGGIKLSVIKISVIAIHLWIVAMGIYLLSYILSEILRIYFIYLEWYTILGFFPVCIAMAAYIHAIYVLSGNNAQGTTVLLTGNIIMVLCAGIIIPISYLPEIFSGLAQIMPASNWNQYCQMILFGELTAKDIFLNIFWIVFWIGIGVVGIWKNSQYGSDSY